MNQVLPRKWGTALLYQFSRDESSVLHAALRPIERPDLLDHSPPLKYRCAPEADTPSAATLLLLRTAYEKEMAEGRQGLRPWDELIAWWVLQADQADKRLEYNGPTGGSWARRNPAATVRPHGNNPGRSPRKR